MLAPRRLGLEGFGDLNCPGDPACPGYVGPGSMDYNTSLLQQILANQGTPAPPDPSAGSLTSFIKTNAIWLEVGLGLMVLIPALTGGRR
jgi:hypothetical protein